MNSSGKIAIALLLFTQLVLAESATMNGLADLRWERRVLLVFSDAAEQAGIETQLNADSAGLAERDISWFLITSDNRILSNHEMPVAAGLASNWRARFAPLSSPVDVLLIGKDGGLKQRVDQFSLQAVFGTVDGMPMRRREMDQRQ